MANTFAVSRLQLIYALCLPLAALMGYFLADPTTSGSVLVVGFVVAALCVPLLMRWHHTLLICCWNAAIALAFLPGMLDLWIPVAILSLLFAILNRATNPDAQFVMVPAINRSLFFLLAVILGTAWLAGGAGVRVLGGSQYGGKGYFVVVAAIAGYFALVSERIPARHAGLYVALFFLSGFTSIIPNLIAFGGKSFEFLYYFFPSYLAGDQLSGGYGHDPALTRLQGLPGCSTALASWLLARHGLSGVFDARKPYRLLLFLAALTGLLFGGFRSGLLGLLVTVAVLFCCEGLVRLRPVLITLAALTLAGAILLPNADKLPLVVQRTISFLPARIDPLAEASAESSSEWRTDMWRDLMPEVPKYLLKGKGYGINPGELDFAYLNAANGFGKRYDAAMIGGLYHNGPLSVIIPFGIWGAIGFCWFVWAGGRYLYRNFQHGDPAIQRLNTFLFALFVAKLIMFFVVVGYLVSDLFVLTGIVGLSVSVNGAEPYQAAEEAEEAEEASLREEVVPI